MSLPQIVSDLIQNTQGSILPFAPELALCGTIVAILLVRLFDSLRRLDVFYLVLIGVGVGLYFLAPWTHLTAPRGEELARQELFTGMLVYDGLSVFIRTVLLVFVLLFAIFTRLSGIPDREDAADFYALVLGATLGLCIMSSANHLLAIFMGVEMASVPSYVLAGMLKGRRQSSEAALKYCVFGAGAAGVMLYGISLLSGILNSAHLPTMALQLAEKLHAGLPTEQLMVLALGGLMLMVGLAYKLSAVPFHFWCPDVFEGASAEVNAFLSVASKAAALALLVRVAIGFGAVPSGYPDGTLAASSPPPAAVAQLPGEGNAGLFSIADAEVKHAGDVQHASTDATAAESSDVPAGPIDYTKALAPARNFAARLIALIAIITCTFGNLAAYGQTNIKRLLAYSTIAHAGYMMMAVPPALVLAGSDSAAAEAAISAMAVYIAIYLFMNLGAFAVVAFLRNAMRSEEISDYAGLIRSCPGVAVCFSLILFSLVGLPPLAGFLGKFAVFAALVDGYQVHYDGYLLTMLVVGGLNTAISLFYYLRVVKIMTIDPEPAHREPVSLPITSLQGLYLLVITAPLALLIVNWNGLNEWARTAARHLLS